MDDLQSAMAEKARKQSKKRKAPATGNQSAKKAKGPIFVQPPNLAKGCVLKDYQLEGVRWMASLFENGVSGILADGEC